MKDRLNIELARKYAAQNPSDPFAFARAMSRMNVFPVRDSNGQAPVDADNSGHLTTD